LLQRSAPYAIIPANAFARKDVRASRKRRCGDFRIYSRRPPFYFAKIRSLTEGRAMPDELLTIELFDDKVGQTFALDETEAPAIPLTLIEAKPLRNYANAKREPFSLLFTSQGQFVLPQRIYALRHDVLGPLSIFLVPLSHEAGITTYQAIFN
jgi:hypothetical protein